MMVVDTFKATKQFCPIFIGILSFVALVSGSFGSTSRESNASIPSLLLNMLNELDEEAPPQQQYGLGENPGFGAAVQLQPHRKRRRGNDTLMVNFAPDTKINRETKHRSVDQLKLASHIHSRKDKALVDLSSLRKIRNFCGIRQDHDDSKKQEIFSDWKNIDRESVRIEPGATVEGVNFRYRLLHRLGPQDGLSTSLLPYRNFQEVESPKTTSLVWYNVLDSQNRVLPGINSKQCELRSSEALALVRSDEKSPAIRAPLQYVFHPEIENSLYIPVTPSSKVNTTTTPTCQKEAEECKTSGKPLEDESFIHPDGTHDHDYILRGQIGRGGQGEVWRAVRAREKTDEGNEDYGQSGLEDGTFILKRIFSYRGRRVVESGWREVYFGELLKGYKHVSALIEYFTVTRNIKYRHSDESIDETVPVTELWLVFADEGSSLHKFIYDPNTKVEETNSPSSDDGDSDNNESLIVKDSIRKTDECSKLLGSKFEQSSPECSHLLMQHHATLPDVEKHGEELMTSFNTDTFSSFADQRSNRNDRPLEASLFWRKLRMDPRGADVFKDLIVQLLEALKEIHESGVTHRDIKPANIVLNTNVHPPLLKFIDFGSGLHDTVLEYLYHDPPSQKDETLAYSPPEVLIDSDCAFFKPNSKTYDLWSAGVIILEFLFAQQPHELFQIDSREEQLIKHFMKDAPFREIRKALLAAGLTRFCIFPQASDSNHNGSLVDLFQKIQQYHRRRSASVPCADNSLSSFRNALRRHNAFNLRERGLSSDSDDLSTFPVKEIGEKGEVGKTFLICLASQSPFILPTFILQEVLYLMLKWDPSERIAAAAAREMMEQ